MASTAAGFNRLTDEELADLLELMKGSDSVELKVTVPASGHRSAVRALNLDPLDAQIRQVFFFDTPDLALYEAGVVVRARRIQGKAHDSVVKLRPVVPAELSDELRMAPAFGVEVDAAPGGYVCSGTLKAKLSATAVRDAVEGRTGLRKLFNGEQRALYEIHAPDGLGLDDLSVLGPVFVLKVAWVPEGISRRVVAEVWLYPDGSRILELSTKCANNEAFQVAAETRAFLARQGIDITGEQQMKTRTALEFFSRELASADASAEPDAAS